MPDPAAMRATLEAYLDGWRRRDKAALLALFSDDIVFEDPVGSAPHVGPGQVEAFIDGVLDGPLELHPTMRRSAICGREAMLNFVMRATSKKSGRGVELEVVDIMRFDDDGKLCEVRAFWDSDSNRPI